MITHDSPEYIARRKALGKAKYNGCYYYSKEIVENIIPRVKTSRDWNTVGRECTGMCDGMIVFLHDNSCPWNYKWLKNYEDLVLVCSSEYTALSVAYSGHVVKLPMSVDTKYVSQFKTKKDKDTCLVGNVWVKENARTKIPGEVDILTSLPRVELLKQLARYKRAYAIDRCAIEAKVLGCELLPLDTRYSVDNVGEVLDNRQAAKLLQQELNKIGGNMKADYRVMNDHGIYVVQQNNAGTWQEIARFNEIGKARELANKYRGLKSE